jgi:uncharacterized membrane protein YedE/YeeE
MNTLASSLRSTARPRTPRINIVPLAVSLAVLVAGVQYLGQAEGWRQGALWIVGALLGATLYHAAFGFTHAWRVFVADRRTAGLRAQVVMLALGVILFFPLMAHGSLFGTHVSGIVAPASLSVVLGAFVFGIGMQIGGGCSSGTLFNLGGGSTRMIITLFFFVVGSVLATYNFTWWATLPSFPPTSMVKTWGWPTALAGYLAVFALAYWGLVALEKRRHGKLLEPDAPVRTGALRLIRGPWPLVWGAVALVVLNFATLALSGRPWSITGAFALWGAKVMDHFGSDVAFWQYWADSQDTFFAPLSHDVATVMDIGIVLGALAAAALAGRFAPSWRIPFRSILGSVIGGILLGFGARLGWGCNIGALFSGMLSGSLHSWIWLPSAAAGCVVGVWLRPLFGMPVERTKAPAAVC